MKDAKFALSIGRVIRLVMSLGQTKIYRKKKKKKLSLTYASPIVGLSSTSAARIILIPIKGIPLETSLLIAHFYLNYCITTSQ